MLSKAEERVRQKAARLPRPIYRIQNEYNPEAIPQYFQISVSIIEARKLAWSNSQTANSYVIVVLGKKKHRTTVRRNMLDPLYNETFNFDMYSSVNILQQTSLWLAVMEPRCCATSRLIGETSVNLGVVWLQPQHQVCNKWIQLSVPQQSLSGLFGFLRVDISIIFKGETQDMTTILRCERLENNFIPSSNPEQQCAKYVTTIYGAFGLPCGGLNQGDRRYSKPPSTFIRVTFCGLVAKTHVQYKNNSPVYNEEVSVIELFPNMGQTLVLDVCSADICCHKILGSAKLKMADISHDGENGFLPAFGPSLVHMYSASNSDVVYQDEGPYYRGCVLLSFNTTIPYHPQNLRSINVEPADVLKKDSFWDLENFCVFCQILEVSMLDRRITGKACGVAMTFGDTLSLNPPDKEFVALMNITRSRKYHYTGCLNVVKNDSHGFLDFAGVYTVLQFVTCLPDFRFRTFRNNMLRRIVDEMESTYSEVEERLKSYDYTSPCELIEKIKTAFVSATTSIEFYLNIIQHDETRISNDDKMTSNYATELDRKQLNLQRDEISKIYKHIMSKKCEFDLGQLVGCSYKNCVPFESRKSVKFLLLEIRRNIQSLKSIIFNKLHGWPDLVIWLLNEGSRVAYCKISADEILYSTIPEQRGKKCGHIHTYYMKPLRCPVHVDSRSKECYCVAGRVELLMWFGLFEEMAGFEKCLSEGYKLKMKDYDMCVKCISMIVQFRAFIYKAKLNRGSFCSKTMNIYVRISIINSTTETKLISGTLLPVWNQVLKINRMVYMSTDRLTEYPPVSSVEIIQCDSTGKIELIGRLEVECTIENRYDYEFAPPLKWYSFYKGAECTGQILMSVQMLQVTETILKTTQYNPTQETIVESSVYKDLCVSESIEPLPRNLVPNSTTYKIDVYWWGLREVNFTRKPCVILEVEDKIVKSDVINDKGGNSNFPNGRTSQFFEAPLDNTYCPNLNLQLYDSTTYGRTLFVGTNVVKNPNKFIVQWLPKQEREASLNCASVMSSDFIQANPVLYIKTSYSKLSNSEGQIASNNIETLPSRRHRWSKIFCKVETDEEVTLLPLSNNKGRRTEKKAISSGQMVRDWWYRYFYSQKDYCGDKISRADKLTIYDSELEAQPQFSKFKDWCTTLKLYSSQKVGEPDIDSQLYCGLLKVGLAIYKWPPAPNTTAVSLSGVDLNNGYFNDHPRNYADNFLIRVYIVKAINLRNKEFCGKSDPYTVVTCGRRQLGNRTEYQPCTMNPIFGKMYEFTIKLPEDYLMTVSLYDFNTISPDELIGSTTVDIEDRIYTKHRARIGLANEYSLTEPIKWHDTIKPSEILEEICMKNHIQPPVFPNNTTVIVNGVEYKDSNKDNIYSSTAERKENLCLSILHNWHTLPICGYHLVPEHVETRSLRCERTGEEQGKVVMWIDIFPMDSINTIPPPLNITPKNIEDYELRIIVYTVRAKFSFDHAGRKVKNILVKTWLGSSEMFQNSDVHYNCDDGDGRFNWRMIFNFQYRCTERKLLIKDKRPFTEFEESLPPILVVQLIDTDVATSDNKCLGSISLNLNDMPQGVKRASECLLENVSKMKKIDLFSTGSIHAWWPLQAMNGRGSVLPAGIIELDIKLLTLDKAILMPVGLGRQGPDPLPEPRRPVSWSFPLLKTFKCIKKVTQCEEFKIPVALVFCIIIVIIVSLIIYFYYLFSDVPSFKQYFENIYGLNK